MTTPLRAKYIRDLAIRGRAERTQQSYSRYVSEPARYYHRSPELISYEEVADWLYYLVEERELSPSSVNIAVNAARFLYGITLGRNTDELMASVPRMKHTIRRAEIYARSEVEAILSAPRQPRDRAFLMTVYACGLRLAEANTVRRAEDDPRQTRTKTPCGHPSSRNVQPAYPAWCRKRKCLHRGVVLFDLEDRKRSSQDISRTDPGSRIPARARQSGEHRLRRQDQTSMPARVQSHLHIIAGMLHAGYPTSKRVLHRPSIFF